MMREGVSFNLYMFHGGTTPGFWNGGNWEGNYRAQTNSYDYSAPLDESGRPTDKYHGFRHVIGRKIGMKNLPPIPAVAATGSVGTIVLSEESPFLAAVPRGETRDFPATMEQLGQGTGFLLYRAEFEGAVDVPLDLAKVRDRVHVLLDGRRIGTGGRSAAPAAIQMKTGEGTHRLDLLVENTGRMNFGPVMNEERKGLTGPLKMGDREISAFEHIPLPLDVPLPTTYAAVPEEPKPKEGELVFRRSKFKAAAPHDTWLDLRGFGRGVVWLNGINLGRYWSIGPQQTIYVPAVWLKSGDEENELVVLELEKDDCPRQIPTLKEPVWSILPGK